LLPDTPQELRNKALVIGRGNALNKGLWNRLVIRITKDLEFQQKFGTESEDIQRLWAEILLDQAVGFLLLCGKDTGNAHAPSPLVDIAWHAFILYTQDYMRFCEKMVGFYIHHVPDDEAPAPEGRHYVEATVERMKIVGISVIEAAWPGRAGCHLRCTEVKCKWVDR